MNIQRAVQQLYKYSSITILSTGALYRWSKTTAVIQAGRPMTSDCSPTKKKFMEFLFITHAECALNEQSHLLEQHSFRSVYSSTPWCQHLIGRPK